MYHILKKPGFPLPTLIKGTDIQYPNLVRQGYVCVDSGMKHLIEAKFEKMMAEVCQEICEKESNENCKSVNPNL